MGPGSDSRPAHFSFYFNPVWTYRHIYKDKEVKECMKREGILLAFCFLFVIVLITGIIAPSNETTTTNVTITPSPSVCTDSDGGLDYYVKGTTVGLFWQDTINQGSLKYYDSCSGCDNNMKNCKYVSEYSCRDDGKVDSLEYPCPNGCYNGVCIKIENKTEEIKEQIKCIFSGSTQLQKCYTAEQNSRAYCSGTESCVAGILGYKGEKITWKSTCGGYAYTIMDGSEEYAKFDCGGTVGICQSYKCDDGSIAECKIDQQQNASICTCQTCPPIIIKPVCGNGICESGEGEICKAMEVMCEVGKECISPPSECSVVCPTDCRQTEGIYANLNEKFKLQVYQSVKILEEKTLIKVEQKNTLMKITFKNLIAYKCAETTMSTGASATMNSKVAIATGMVIASDEELEAEDEDSTEDEEISGIPTEGTISESDDDVEVLRCVGAGPKALLEIDMIVNSELGKHLVLNLNVGEKKQVGEFTVSFFGYDYASRTGTFLVTRETFSCPERCKCDENGKVIECAAESCEKEETLCPDGICRDECSITSEDCKYGCSYEGKCFPIGVRSNGTYCSEDLSMDPQLDKESSCENNFECSSNVCISGECISSGLMSKILRWFKGMFGG